MRVNVALKSRELSSSLASGDLENNVSERALAIIVSALGINLLRAAGSYALAKAVRNELQKRYTEKAMVNKLITSKTLLNTKVSKDGSMGDHIAKVE